MKRMDSVMKWRRLTNPQTVEDYALVVNIRELLETPEGRVIFESEILPYIPVVIHAPLREQP